MGIMVRVSRCVWRGWRLGSLIPYYPTFIKTKNQSHGYWIDTKNRPQDLIFGQVPIKHLMGQKRFKTDYLVLAPLQPYLHIIIKVSSNYGQCQLFHLYNSLPSILSTHNLNKTAVILCHSTFKTVAYCGCHNSSRYLLCQHIMKFYFCQENLTAITDCPNP